MKIKSFILSLIFISIIPMVTVCVGVGVGVGIIDNPVVYYEPVPVYYGPLVVVYRDYNDYRHSDRDGRHHWHYEGRR